MGNKDSAKFPRPDYLFRWMVLCFLSGKQLALFVAQAAAGDRSDQIPASVSQCPEESYASGDAPLCTTCGSLTVANGSCYKCGNCCDGTSTCS